MNILHDKETEAMVLGTIIQMRDALDEVRGLLHEDCFYVPFHKAIYNAICKVCERGDRADLIAVRNQLTADKVEYNLIDYMNVANSTTFDLYQYAARLHDLAVRRKFWDIGQMLVSNSQHEGEDILDVTNDALNQLTATFASDATKVEDMKSATQKVMKMVSNNINGVKLSGTPTGFSKIDSKTGGLQKSDLIIIAGETSQGKTSMAVSMMVNAAEKGARVAMYSMEMRMEQVAARVLAMKSGIPGNSIMYAKLNDEQLMMVDKGVAQMMELPIYFDDRSTSNIDTIISSIRYMKKKFDIDGAVVDYLQILNVNMKGSNKEQQMGEVARRLKNLAKDLDIWIIALSQLSRDKDNPVPSLSRLRDSGQIAEAADVVMLIYRPEVYGKTYPAPITASTKDTALIDIAKGRNSGLMKFICGFKSETTHFYDLNDIPRDEENLPF